MTPRISVITSTYNRPERLKRAIASVQRQTFADWEMLIVEDGETAELAATIGALQAADPRVRYFALPTRSGSDPAPKNLGIEESRADLIAFLDDDNVYRPDHLAALYQAMQGDPTLDVVYGDRWAIDESGRYPPQIGTYAEQFSVDLLLRQNFIDTSDVLVRRDALRYVGGFDERYRKFVDWNLWVRLAKAGFRFRRVPRILTNYSLHGDAKSARPEDERAPQTPAWSSFDLEIRLPFLGPVGPPSVAILCATKSRLVQSGEGSERLGQSAGYPFDLYQGEQTRGGIAALSGETDRYHVIGRVAADAVFLTHDWLKAIVDVWTRNHLLATSPSERDHSHRPDIAARIAHGQIHGEPIAIAQAVSRLCVFADRRAWRGFHYGEAAAGPNAWEIQFARHLQQRGYFPAMLPNHVVSVR